MKHVTLTLVILVAICLGCIDSKPNVEILLESGGWINTTEGTLVFTVSDNSGEDLICDIELNSVVIGTITVSSGSTATYAMTLIEGQNSIRVKATDKAGNSAWSNTYIVNVDMTPPSVVIVDFQVTP